MNIYSMEFKMNARSVITWSLSVVILLLVFTLMYNVVASEAEALNTVLENYPPELLVAFGMDGLDFASVLGFFSFTILFVQLCISIQAANYGISLISIEERDLTADFLLAKPVSRVQILTNKLLAALTGLAITNVVIWVCSFVFLDLFSNGEGFDQRILVLMLVTVTFLQLFFLAFGLFISLLLKKVRSVLPISMGLVFGFYILNAFGDSFGNDIFTYITPFRHFETNAIIKTGNLELPLVLISVAVTLLSLIASYWLYQKRDVHSV